MSVTSFKYSVLFWVILLLTGCALKDGVVLSHQPHAGMIASAHPLATKAGLAVLAEGGNAFDAAVTVAAVLAVVEPFGSGLGGGGFWLLHDQLENKSIFIDGREKAPLASSSDMYLDENGDVDRELALNHPLAAAIPGTPAALVHVQSQYGSLALSRLLAPAILYAREGFPVTTEYQDALKMRLSAIQKWPSSSVFLKNNEIPPVGWRLIQTDLANTLEVLAREGRSGFYAGDLASKMVESVQANGGVWTLADLSSYDVVERTPVQYQFNGFTVTSAPLPSSGGLVLGSVFGQLESLGYHQKNEQDRLHLWLEANRNAYHQRAIRMGDPDFTQDQGLDLLTSRHVDQLASMIPLDRAGDSARLGGAVDAGVQGDQTTHFSIIDKAGNRAGVTLSINLYFGNGFVAKGTGVLLNNEMDDFSAKPGSPNAYGLVGSHANKIEPGKRPLSSMTPTFLENEEEVWVIGTPGGSRIITMVGRAVLTAMQGGTPEEVVKLGRVHHQYLPDTVYVELNGVAPGQIEQLKKRGHNVVQMDRDYGDMQVVRWNKITGKIDGAADPRGEGLASSVEEMIE